MITYAVHDIEWYVRDIMTTDKPISEIVHPDLAYLFIEIPEGVTVVVGDKYDPETDTWTHIEPEEPEESEVE